MRVYDFFLPAGAEPHLAVVEIETDLPGVKLFHRGDGETHGFVNTSVRPDGSLYVSVHLYDEECLGCDLHPGIVHRVSPVLSAPAEAKLAQRESAAARLLGADKVASRALLISKGFRAGDGPMRDD